MSCWLFQREICIQGDLSKLFQRSNEKTVCQGELRLLHRSESFRSSKRHFSKAIQTFVSSDVTRSSRVISGTYKHAFESITLRQDLNS